MFRNPLVQFVETPIYAMITTFTPESKVPIPPEIGRQFVRSFTHLSETLVKNFNWFADGQLNINTGYVLLQEKVYLMLTCLNLGQESKEYRIY